MSELSRYLHIHRNTIYRLLKSGALLGAFKIGADWRFHREEVDRWLQQSDADSADRGQSESVRKSQATRLTIAAKRKRRAKGKTA